MIKAWTKVCDKKVLKMIEIMLQTTLLHKYTSNFPLLGYNVLTHTKEKVIHVVVNVVSVSCYCEESNNIKMCIINDWLGFVNLRSHGSINTYTNIQKERNSLSLHTRSLSPQSK